MGDKLSLYSSEGQNILLLLPWVYIHMIDIMNNCFDLQTYLGCGNVTKDSFGGGLCVMIHYRPLIKLNIACVFGHSILYYKWGIICKT